MIQGAALADARADHRGRHQPGARRPCPASSAPPTSSAPTVPTSTLIEAVKEICPNGVDYVFECVGHPALIRTSIDMLDWGGTVRHARRAQDGHRGQLRRQHHVQRQVDHGLPLRVGRPHHDIPLMVELYQAGRLKLDELVSQTYPLDDFQQALDDMHHGKLARGVLTFD